MRVSSASRALSWPRAGSAWPVIAGLIAMAVYFLTLAPDLSWANASTDGGEFITGSVTLGIPHPPGYPTYVLVGKLFSLLPFGTMAYRFNLLSAVCMAGTIVLLARTAIRFWQPRVRPVAAAAAALAFGFLPLVWSQATITEVYGLNVLLLAAFLYTWSGGGSLFGSGMWLGLAATAHLTSLLWLPLAFLGAERHRGRLLAGLATGLMPLSLLPWLARGNSPVVWGQPDDLAGWWWLVSGRLYAANLNFVPDGSRLSALLNALWLGPAALWVAGQRTFGQTTAGAAEWINRRPHLLAGTAVLYGLFALTYSTPDAAVLLIPALMILALLAAPVLQRVRLWALVLPLALVILGFGAQDRGNDRVPRRLAEAVLSSAPRDAILLAPGDRTIFTLWYFHYVEGLRPDVRLVDANLFAFDWYRARLAVLNADLRVPADDDLAGLRLLNAPARPFCAVSLVSMPETLTHGWELSSPFSAGPPFLLCDEVSR